VTGSPLKKPEGISWNAAQIELPEIPMLPPGADAMSATISAFRAMTLASGSGISIGASSVSPHHGAPAARGKAGGAPHPSRPGATSPVCLICALQGPAASPSDQPGVRIPIPGPGRRRLV